MPKACPVEVLGKCYAAAVMYAGGHMVGWAKEHDEYRNEGTGKLERQRVLWTHQAAKVVHGQLLAPVVWPLMVYDNLTYLECKVRGEDWRRYGSVGGRLGLY